MLKNFLAGHAVKERIGISLPEDAYAIFGLSFCSASSALPVRGVLAFPFLVLRIMNFIGSARVTRFVFLGQLAPAWVIADVTMRHDAEIACLQPP